MLMKKLVIILCVIWLAMPAVMWSQTGVLPRSKACEQNVDPDAVSRWIDTLMALPGVEMHHIMVVRNGHVIAESHPSPFKATDLHTLYSCSKTFTSLAVGIAIDENRLRLTDRVATFFPDKLPEQVSEELSNLTVEHLLTMSSGIVPDNNITRGTDWIRDWLAKPFDEQGRFRYDNMCTYTLSAIVQRVTGKKLLDYLKEKVFGPLGITEVDWEESPDGTNTGAWGLRLQAESLAKIGMLIVNGGQWNGRRIVSREWIETASAKHINYKYPGDTPTDNNQGYGFQMWRCLYPTAFRADGAFGQYIVMDPTKNLVVVMNGVAKNPSPELRATWNLLMPGVNDAPVALNEKSERRLLRKCEGTALPHVGEGKKKANKALLGDVFPIEANKFGYKTAEIVPVSKDRILVRITKENGTEESIPHGFLRWEEGMSQVAPPFCDGPGYDGRDHIAGINNDFGTAGSYGWNKSGELVINTYYTTWIVRRTLVVNHVTRTARIEVNY